MSERKRLELVRAEVQQVAGEFEVRITVDSRTIDFAVHPSLARALWWARMRRGQISDVVDEDDWRREHGLQALEG